MLDRLGINPTQLVGTIAFAAAMIACLLAARDPTASVKRAWVILALINCLFLVEVLVGFRHRIHDLGATILMAGGTYAHRAPLQKGLISLFAALSFALAVLVLFRVRFAPRTERIAASLTIAVLALFAIEAISLHALDAVFYRPIGPVLLIGWIWAGTCALTVVAAFWRRSRPHFGSNSNLTQA